MRVEVLPGMVREALRREVNNVPQDVQEVRVFAPEQLPSAFLLTLDNPPAIPSPPEPSATLVLLRQAESRLEVLLLQRSPRSGFIPGAWVFPGGRVDGEDGDSRVLSRIRGSSAEEARYHLGTTSEDPSPLAFWVAAVRETFEETGVLMTPGSEEVPPKLLEEARRRLLKGETGFPELLQSMDLVIDTRRQVYAGHWLTPECEPRRYETRLFVSEAPRGVPVRPHQEEMVSHRWLSPTAALRRNQAGSLPLVLPTLFTLEQLQVFRTPTEALESLRNQPVPRRLPQPDRVDVGVRFRFAL